MTPSIGRIVINRKAGDIAHPGVANSSLESPAIITRILASGRVNLQVFFDGESTSIRVSVPALPPGHDAYSGSCGWRWPDRV